MFSVFDSCYSHLSATPFHNPDIYYGIKHFVFKLVCMLI